MTTAAPAPEVPEVPKAGVVLVRRNWRVWKTSWSQLWPDCKPLMEQHRRELGRDRFPLSPDHQRILELEKGGGLLCFAAREREEAGLASPGLVGYGIWYLAPSLESHGVLLGFQGPWYVLEGWRSGGVGMALLRAGVEALRAAGASAIDFHHPESSPELGKLFLHLGAPCTESVYTLYL